MNKIILISGKATNGKDALGEHLKRRLEEQGEVVVIDRFAKYIKSYLKDYYGWDGITKDDKVRSRLQTLGTDIIKERLNYKSFHAKRLAEDIQINSDYIDTFIITDTRFRDEIYMIKAILYFEEFLLYQCPFVAQAIHLFRLKIFLGKKYIQGYF